MRKLLYKKVDAFIAGESLGNPAAYIQMEDQKLSSEQMLEIANQHKHFVSEVVFLESSRSADYKLTYYSSECEVAFCGHGTVATMYDVIKDSMTDNSKKQLTIETNQKGTLTIYNRIQEDDAIFLTAPEPIYLIVPVTMEQTVQALGADAEAINAEKPVEFIDAGLRTLIVPFHKLQEMVSLFPGEEQLKEFCLENGIDIILVFCKETKKKDCFVHSRVFAPKFGYLEDPATGSGNSALGYYLKKNGMWDGNCIKIEQGGEDRIYNEVKIMDQDGMILFGGNARARIEGSYLLQE